MSICHLHVGLWTLTWPPAYQTIRWLGLTRFGCQWLIRGKLTLHTDAQISHVFPRNHADLLAWKLDWWQSWFRALYWTFSPTFFYTLIQSLILPVRTSTRSEPLFLIFYWSRSLFPFCMQQNVGPKGAGDESQKSMLQVICSQRDRFRQRLQDTEEVNKRLAHFHLSTTSQLPEWS